MTDEPIFLIIGGTGGIGQALIEQCLQRYPTATVHTTWHQQPSSLEHARVHWHALDVTSEDAVAALAQQFDHIDCLINAVGLLHDGDQQPEKALRQVDPDFFVANIRANTLPSILLAKHFARSLKSTTTSHFVALSARVGSIDDNRLGGWLSYRSSKAALNMAMKTVAIEWQRSNKHCCLFLFHPGTTDTALSKPFQARVPEQQLQSPAFTAEALLNLIDRYGPEDSGRFVDYAGRDIRW